MLWLTCFSQCADVNAFLTLAATSHLLCDDDTDERVSQILEAARSGTGSVPVQLCAGGLVMTSGYLSSAVVSDGISDLSEKNPLVTMPSTATILSLLELFSRGTHRGFESMTIIFRRSNFLLLASNYPWNRRSRRYGVRHRSP